MIPTAAALALAALASAQEPFVLRRSLEFSQRHGVTGATIRGRFVDAQGNALGGGVVALREVNLPTSAEVTVAADGSFALEVDGEAFELQLLHADRLRFTLKVLTALGGCTDLGVLRVPDPDPELPAAVVVRGVVTARTGTPLQGMRVVAYSAPNGEICTVTDTEGRFALRPLGLEAAFMGFAGGGSFVRVDHLAGEPELSWRRGQGCADFTTPLRITLAAVPIACKVTGATGAELARLDCGWTSLTGLFDWRPEDGRTLLQLYRVTCPEHLPRTRSVARDRPVPFACDFGDDVPFALDVVDARGPVADAEVAILAPSSISLVGTTVATLRTDASGQLRLLGPPASVTELLVRAPGRAAVRATWTGEPLRVELPLTDATLVLRGIAADEWALLLPHGRPDPVAVIGGPLADDAPDRARIAVAAGAYDVLVCDRSGAARRCTTAEVQAGKVAAVDAAADRRARLMMRMPPRDDEQPWTVRVVSPGRPGPVRDRTGSEDMATCERTGEHDWLTVLPRSGRYWVIATTARSAIRYEHAVDAVTGRDQVLELPPLTGVLAGGPIGRARAEKEWLSMWLVPRAHRGWRVVAGGQAVTENGELHDVPAGDYAFCHGIDDEDEPRGGVAVSVGRYRSVVPEAPPAGPLQVRVETAAGVPARGVIGIRTWRSNPGSWPDLGPRYWQPREPVRLRGGAATLPSVRAGLLELAFEADDGSVFEALVPVDPQRELLLRLPPP